MLRSTESPVLMERVGGLCGLTSGVVLLAYFLWGTFVVPPFSSGRAFLEFAAAHPRVAFLDDWLLLAWFVLVVGLLLGVHRRLAGLASDEIILASVVGALGLMLGIVRGVFNIGRLQVLAAHFGPATESDRDVLVALLAWTEAGDVARNLGLVLVGGWVVWTSSLGLRLRMLPRWVCGLGFVAGVSVVPALIGYMLGISNLTQPDRYLALVFLLWAGWTAATGLALLRQTPFQTVSTS